MIRAIVETGLRFRLLLVAVAAATLVVGITQLRDMPVDVLPEFAPVTVEIQTEALGLSAAEVEQLITVPIEQDLLAGVAFLEDIRSESVSGLSRILLVFEPGTDLFRARQVVAERLTQAHALPNVSAPPLMLQPLSSTNRVLTIGATSKTLSPIDMGVLARWTIVPKLLGVTGVANVSVWGARDRQLQIQVDPERLRDRGVTLAQIIETAGNALWFSPLSFVEASTPGTGGFVDTTNQRLGVQHFSPITNATDLGEVSVAGTGGELQLADVSTVVENHQPLIGDALLNGGDAGGLLLVIEKLPEANVLDVTRGVEDALAAMKPGLPGLDLDPNIYRPASYIDDAIGNLTLALIISSILLALALGAFLFRWRTALIGIFTIPLSLVIAALVLGALGTTMNAVILLGLVAALALVIDEAVIGVFDVTHRLRENAAKEGDERRSGAEVVLEATTELRRPAVYGTLIVAAATVPLLFLDGLAGSFFPDAVGAYLLALVAAMAVAMTVTPALAVVLLSRASFESGESPLLRWLRPRYEAVLSWVVRRPRTAAVAAGAVLVAAVAAAPFLHSSLLPTFKEQQLLVRWEAQPGTSLPEMQRISGLASRELRALPGVTEVGTHVGRAVTSDAAVGTNSAELWVSIDRDADYDATLASIQDVAAGYPGIEGSIRSFSNDRSQAILTGAEDDVVVRVYGEDSEVLQQEARKVQAAIAGVQGISQPRVKLPAQEASLEVEVDLARAQQFGIKPGDVRRAAATLLGGIHVGSLFEEQKVFDVIVWGTPETRTSLTSIRNLLLDTPEGGHVRLQEVADVRIAPEPAVIERQGISRYLDVAVDVNGRSVSSVVNDVEDRLSGLAFPLEYHVEVIGASGQPTSRLIGLAIGAAVAIFLLLQASFGSWGLAALCFSTLPVAGAGAVLAALAAGGDLSLGSLVGLIAVMGLAARNGLALISRLRSLEESEGERLGPALVVRAASERLGPVALTAVATGLVMLPVAVIGGIPGYETIQPLSIVVLGGLLTSTLLSLFVLPALYLRVAPRLRFEATQEELGSIAGFMRRRVAPRPRVKEPVLRASETSVESGS